jgi:hypothetical protein
MHYPAKPWIVYLIADRAHVPDAANGGSGVRFDAADCQLLFFKRRRSDGSEAAMCGRLRAVKGLIDIALLVGAAMCSAF